MGDTTLANVSWKELSCRLVLSHIPKLTFGAGGILETIVCERASRAGLRPGTPGLLDPDPEAPSGIAPMPVAAEFRTALKVNAGFAGVNGAVVLERV